jgi:hypothetical protein
VTLLKDKVFVFAERPVPNDSELEVLNLIFEAENLGPVFSAKIIKTGEYYDSYEVVSGGGTFCVKLSLDENNPLEREKNVLEELDGLGVSPKILSQGELDFGQTIYYSVTSWLEGKSLEEIGMSGLNYQEPFLSSLKSIHTASCNRSFQEYISQLFNETSLTKHPEFDELVKKNSKNYQLLTEELESAKNDIRSDYKLYLESDKMVHGNISDKSSIINGGNFSFINWEHVFNANPLVDIATAKLNIGFGEDLEYSLVQNYQQGKWEEYLSCRDFCAKLELLKNVFSFIKEIYLYEGKRSLPILNLVEKFYRNAGLFEKNPSFKRNKNEILELFNQATF